MSSGEHRHNGDKPQAPAQEVPVGEPAAPDEPTRAVEPSCNGQEAPAVQGLELAGYRVIEELHRGGQGIVYRAIQLGTRRQVALKVLSEGPFAGEAARRRFEREVELAASLRHPNIVTILDSGISQGCYYFAMEFIEGLRLDRYLAQVRPPLADTLRLFCKICDAINFAHQRGVIHRDLKPSNILIDARGEPHVLDFGLAKPVGQVCPDQPTVQRVSVAGELLGTIAYMSPEQTRGVQDIDVRSDVYSLGVIFYEALVGRLPYSVQGPLGDVLRRICEAEPTPLRTLRRNWPFGGLLGEELETILLKALEKSPERRYQSAGELGRDLEHVLRGEPIEAKRASGWYVFRKFLRRHRVETTAAAMVLLLVLGFAGVFGFMWQAEREALRLASRHRTEALQRAIEVSQSKEQLQRVLHQQTIQRGQAALARGDTVVARDFFWQAFLERDSAAALWALRQYYWGTGDQGARAVFVERCGPVVLSPSGRLVGVCESPGAITVRNTQDGSCLAWRCAPGPVLALQLSDDCSVAAAGRGWGRLWQAQRLEPGLAVEFPADFEPLYVCSSDAGRVLSAVGQTRCYIARQDPEPRLISIPLRGRCAGQPDWDPGRGIVAVPTTAGVELIHTESATHSELLACPASSVFLARFAGRRLVVAGDGNVYSAQLDSPGPVSWDRIGAVPAEDSSARDCRLLDADPESGTVAVGLRDGRALIFTAGGPPQSLAVCTSGLAALRLADSGTRLITVDETGSVTRWALSGSGQRAQTVFERPIAAWAQAEDGSGVLLADERGRVFACGALPEPKVRAVQLRRPVRLPLPGEAPTLLAASRELMRVVVCDGAG
jgi:predicted Ser/Thr protein kinase